MAGIGFTLRKVLARGEMGSSVRAALSGILIVAGPWILSIISLSIVTRSMGSLIAADSSLFVAQLVYSYASSIIFFTPIHLLFTRLIADLIWEKREAEASNLLIRFCILTAVLSMTIALPWFMLMPLEGIQAESLFRWGAVLFYVFINLIWLILLFTSLLRWYGRILLLMSAGMAAAIFLIWKLGRSSGISGAMMGFALGHGLIVLSLLILGLRSQPPIASSMGLENVKEYMRRYARLIAAGSLANAGIWIDKIIYWFTRGETAGQSMYRIYAGYDLAVYYANLIMIPGLVYFIIFGETGFYTYLRRFLITLEKGSYMQLQKSKFAMIRGMKRELGNQQLFQGGITLVAILLVPSLQTDTVQVPVLYFQISGLVVFLQLFLLTLLNYLYYFEFYSLAFNTAGLYFLLNAGLTLGSELLAAGIPNLSAPLPGLTIGIALLCSVSYGYRGLVSNAKKIDRIILTRN